jgi:alkylation response protein AidB-like acyl-CoA dehydrogenase
MIGIVELLVLAAVSIAGVGVLIAVAWRLTRSRYRELADQMVAAHEANERRLAEIAAELSAMRTQLASLERVLTQIE